ncbi:hypothetical protein [Streptomyces sp. NBC_01477]|uniref:hypothetical protein n=1 Tax=Streptomyces sp. NBC_01477 TaxID=2976015 RepID=UPI002E37775E|nr:hypothetical protein [Streptomyces sp. NBC_01477]
MFGLDQDGTIAREGSLDRVPAASAPVVDAARARITERFGAARLHSAHPSARHRAVALVGAPTARIAARVPASVPVEPVELDDALAALRGRLDHLRAWTATAPVPAAASAGSGCVRKPGRRKAGRDQAE